MNTVITKQNTSLKSFVSNGRSEIFMTSNNKEIITIVLNTISTFIMSLDILLSKVNHQPFYLFNDFLSDLFNFAQLCEVQLLHISRFVSPECEAISI
jgi:hypothetical protein